MMLTFVILTFHAFTSLAIRVWHVTDFHLDPMYVVDGDPTTMCHTPIATGGASALGDYLCDAPKMLVENSIKFIASKAQPEDIVLWTGDGPPHVNISELSEEKVIAIISNVTSALRRFLLPSIRVFPCLGNHDYYPKGQFPPSPTHMYAKIAYLWRQWLSENAIETFIKGGYYQANIGEAIIFVSLNTNLYYNQDLLTPNEPDPAGQFQWLTGVLETAKNLNKKAFIFGHVPPGAFERIANTTWYYPQFNSAYISLVKKYSDVISGQFFAHQHSDSFKIIYDDNSMPVSIILLGPSVTPWKTTLPNVTANNPGVRLMMINDTTTEIQGYIQYYTNLQNDIVNNNYMWKEEYRTSSYGLKSLTPTEMNNLVLTFIKQNSTSFEQYYRYCSVSYPQENCDSQCKKVHLCSITKVDYVDYNNCLVQ